VTTPPPAPYAGRYGTAEPIPYDPAAPGCTETVAYWLLTAGIYHPLWHQYALAVVRLRDAPGYPPPVLRYPDATHELLVMALDPTSPDDPANPGARVTYTPQALEGLAAPYLQPINIAGAVHRHRGRSRAGRAGRRPRRRRRAHQPRDR
jgi:hypothetical protein